jgi:hypothetical protein
MTGESDKGDDTQLTGKAEMERPELPSFIFSCEELLEAQQRSAKGSLQVNNHAIEQYW